ncbi:hypothetical protein GGS23DRAFT_610990 [Durotheca rogersii]|uniref:uncharacterized protein n=1 Tax=Durotheca rogersii TaxID=419775 RepID=UPI00221F6D47|nr:uncharacterized protein GGS23DRAFT_610990 [Durotheca rogersii]KAI5861881.1 hypothetical protein GGS23DRAFT_610990 [Durotheca rogersii]
MVLIHYLGVLSAVALGLVKAQNISADTWPHPTYPHCEPETITKTKLATTTVYGTTTVFATVSFGITVTKKVPVTTTVSRKYTVTEKETKTATTTVSHGYTVTDEETVTATVSHGYTVTDEDTVTATVSHGYTVTDSETITDTITTTYTSLVPTVTTTTYTYSTTIPTTIISDRTLITTEYSTSVYTTVSTYTTSVLSTFTDTLTVTEISVSVSPTTDTATVTATEISVSVSPTTDTATVTATEISVSASLTTDTATVTATEETTAFVTLISTTTFITTSEITITDSVVSTATFTTTEVITIVSQTTFIVPPTTTTATVTTTASVCAIPSQPPSLSVPYDPRSNLTWGCFPGTVCSPPKPPGCRVWAQAPPETYVCDNQAYCIPSPPWTPVTWESETGYYPPTEGYFNLVPEAFGLSYGIFDIEEYVITTITAPKKTYTTTYATGNWESQSDLTDWTTTTSAPARTTALAPRMYQKHAALSKRVPTIPARCYATCNNGFREAQRVGKDPRLCDQDSAFMNYYRNCLLCAAESDDWVDPSRTHAATEMRQYLGFCEARDATPEPGTTPEAELGTSREATTFPGGAPNSNTGVATQSPTFPSRTVEISSTTSPPTTSTPTSPPTTSTPTTRPGNLTTSPTVTAPTTIATAGARAVFVGGVASTSVLALAALLLFF